MLCSWCICGFNCLWLDYPEASHFDLCNYTFFEYLKRDCEASHSKNVVFRRKHPYANSVCVQIWQNN